MLNLMLDCYPNRAPVESADFLKWFKGSKVVDQNGAPLMVYHGTSGSVFDSFQTPAFFSPEIQAANYYALYFRADEFQTPRGARIIPVYLKIANPMRLKGKKGSLAFIALAQRAGVKIDVIEHQDGSWSFNTDEIQAVSNYDGTNLNDLIYSERVRSQLLKEGFDGIEAWDTIENTEPTIWVPISKYQIRSAFCGTMIDTLTIEPAASY